VTFRIFISSVQREFAKERRALVEYIRRDAIHKIFEGDVFEMVDAATFFVMSLPCAKRLVSPSRDGISRMGTISALSSNGQQKR